MEAPVYKKKDFVSNQEVRWCPGCGDYAILSSLQLAMTKMGISKEKIVCISGIGCSSRFPYYMDTFGLHTIHGRAPAVASGLKIQNPELNVWIITGDGDGLSIGGNHLIHALRRNLDVNILLFNNEIYGLTKGQYSPTSQQGKVTKSSPFGSIDRTFVPGKLALGAGSTFYARTIDTDPKHMMETMQEAVKHKGTSLVEIYQNCVIFNDKQHDLYTAKETRDDHSIRLEHGKPMIFGKESNKGLVMRNFKFEVVTLGEDGVLEGDLVVHDETNEMISQMLVDLKSPDFPIPLGVVKRAPEGCYEDALHAQIAEVKKKKGEKTVDDLLYSGDTWKV